MGVLMMLNDLMIERNYWEELLQDSEPLKITNDQEKEASEYYKKSFRKLNEDINKLVSRGKNKSMQIFVNM